MKNYLTSIQTYLLFCLIILCHQSFIVTSLYSQDIIPGTNQSEQDSVIIQSSYENLLYRLYLAKFDLLKTMQNQSDLGLKFNTKALYLKQYEALYPIFPELYKSKLEKSLDLRSGGGSQNLLISPAQILSQFQKTSDWEKKQGFRYNLIPSNLQLEVLKQLWGESTATNLKLYASLDSTYLVTAENCGRQLSRMVNLGMVERKIISPQNLFSFITPFNVFQIEMSGLNRRNKVYLYRTKVDKEKILQILLVKSYQLRNDEVGSESEVKKINKKINIVLSGS